MLFRNKTVPILFRSLYLLIGAVGILASLGLFDGAFREDFYLPFTHLSNYACIGIVGLRLVYTVKTPSRRAEKVISLLSFMGLAAILLTFTVFHLVLAPAPNRDPSLNTRPVSIIFHLILPLMYATDWVLFSKHGTCLWFDPLISVLSPLVYVIFVYTRAALLSFDSSRARLYPYFFLDLDSRTIPAIAVYMGLILVGYATMGYMLLAIDRLLKRSKQT